MKVIKKAKGIGVTVIKLDDGELRNLKDALNTLVEIEHNAAEKVGDDVEYHYFAESLLEELSE